MTQEQNAKLLQAYRAAIAVGHYGIADALEDVILELMDKTRPSLVSKERTTTEGEYGTT